jgi:hypothetical protein
MRNRIPLNLSPGLGKKVKCGSTKRKLPAMQAPTATAAAMCHPRKTEARRMNG